MSAMFHCVFCGRDLAGVAADDICSFCVTKYPAATTALRNPVAYSPPGMTQAEQDRQAHAIDVVLQDAFFGPDGTSGGLQRA